MSNAVYEAGSPLAEYLDEGVAGTELAEEVEVGDREKSETDNGGDSSMEEGDRLIDVKRARNRVDFDNASSPVRPSPRRALSSDRFSEQFKYLICSSALLEKDYVPGYRGLDEEKSDIYPISNDGSVEEVKGPSTINTLLRVYPDWINWAREKWDISIAISGLLLGIVVLLGWIPCVITISVATAAAIHLRNTTVVPLSPSTISAPSSAQPSPTSFDPRHGSLDQIKHLIESSQHLDDSIEKTLSHFTKQPGNISHLHALRLSLNHLTTNMIDHLATATSSLLELGDKDELKVLGEMYDVQMSVNGRPGKRISLTSSNSSIETEDGTVPAPRYPGLSLSLETPQSSRYSLAMSVSRSLPGNQFPSFHDPEDRFTPVPLRTPRSAKRAGREHAWNPRRSPLSESSSDASPQLPSMGILPSPFAANTKRRSLQSVPYTLPQITDSMTSPRPEMKSFISPLSDTTSQLPSRGNLPSPFTSNPKRRSLQNMPYNPSTLDTSRGADLTRTRSMPFSDIQALRSRYATGRHTRSDSLVPPPSHPDAFSQPLSPDPFTPKIRRVISVSPLSLASLKAACLDIHLRRRRVACCLLGLRFDHMDNEYWEEVVRIMRVLGEKADEERKKLDDALEEIIPVLPRPTLTDSRPPWMAHPAGHDYDFAPRTSDATLLNDRIEEIQNTLNRAWAGLVNAKRALGDGDQHALDKAWKDVRTNLGEMVRDWEKGKEVVKRMSTPEPPTSDSISETHEVEDSPDDVPSFAKTWSENTEPPAVSLESEMPTSLNIQPGDYHPEEYDNLDNLLTPVGKEEVFEVEIPDAPARPKSDMSREERIRMTKEARGQGLSLRDYLERERDKDGFVKRREEMEMLKQGGMVVDELRGMMDLIRAKKDQG